MKHLLNNLSEEEKNSIREHYKGELKVNTERFKSLMESKVGDVKPLISEQLNRMSGDSLSDYEKDMEEKTMIADPKLTGLFGGVSGGITGGALGAGIGATFGGPLGAPIGAMIGVPIGLVTGVYGGIVLTKSTNERSFKFFCDKCKEFKGQIKTNPNSESWAKEIYDAANEKVMGVIPSTNEDKIYKIFNEKIKSTKDFCSLVLSYEKYKTKDDKSTNPKLLDELLDELESSLDEFEPIINRLRTIVSNEYKATQKLKQKK